MRSVRSLRRGAVRVFAVFLASLVCVGATGWGHTAWDEDLYDPVPVHHDHNAHRFQCGALAGSPDSDHCFLCHSLRSLRGAPVTTHVPVADNTQIAAVRSPDGVLAGSFLESAGPSRAPPTAHL